MTQSRRKRHLLSLLISLGMYLMFSGCGLVKNMIARYEGKEVESSDDSRELDTLALAKAVVRKTQEEIDRIRFKIKLLAVPRDYSDEQSQLEKSRPELNKLLASAEENLKRALAEKEVNYQEELQIKDQSRKPAPPWPTQQEVDESKRRYEKSRMQVRHWEDVIAQHQAKLTSISKREEQIAQEISNAADYPKQKAALLEELDAAIDVLGEAIAEQDKIVRERRRAIIR